MRKFKKIYKEDNEIAEVHCNMCGNIVENYDGLGFYDYLSVDKKWGYPSDFDGENHSFDLCEACYKNLISSFKINIYCE